MALPKLKPCPHCGGDTLLWGYEGWNGGISSWRVECDECDGGHPLPDQPPYPSERWRACRICRDDLRRERRRAQSNEAAREDASPQGSPGGQ